jgi:hypothetical protein
MMGGPERNTDMHRDVRYFTGVDLGQTQDFTALAVLERCKRQAAGISERRANHYAVRHLERFALGTPYTSVCTRLVCLFESEPLAGSTLAVDQTGVGRPVLDMLRRSGIKAAIQGVTITGGHKAAADPRGGWLVPKKELVSNLLVFLQSRRIQFARPLPETSVLVKELLDFQVKITPAAHENFGPSRDGTHDDLVLAVMLAAWLGEHFQELTLWC